MVAVHLADGGYTFLINTVPIETGLTNAVIKNAGSRVVGLNSENPELHEGMI